MKPSEEKETIKKVERLVSRIIHGFSVVEGRKDALALKRLGADNVFVSAGRPFDVCEEISGMDISEVILLTDLDRKGESLLKVLEKELWSRGIKTDTRTRKEISGILKIRDFENIDKKYEKFKESW